MDAMLTYARHSLCVGHVRIDTDEIQQECLGSKALP